MTSPYDAPYSDELDERGLVYEGITGALLMVSVTVWACIWGAIWLLSGLYVALHFREDHRRSAVDAPGLDEDHR